MGLIAKTTFETGPNDNVAVVDVYKDAKTEPVNGIQTPPTVENNKVSKDFVPVDKNKDLLSKTFNDFKDKKIPLKDTIEKFSNIVREPKLLGKEIGGNLLQGYFNELGIKANANEVIEGIKDPEKLTTTLAEINPDFKVIADGVSHVRKAKEIGTANAIIGALSEMTGNKDLLKVFNIGADLTVFKGLLDTALELRIPEIADLVIDQVKESKERNRLKLIGTMNAAKHSDLEFIINASDDSDVGLARVKGLYPNLIYVLLENYRLPPNVNYPTKEVARKLVDYLYRFDIHWKSSRRNGVEIDDLSKLGRINNTALDVLMMDDRTVVIAILLKEYKSINSVEDTLKRRPYSVKKEKIEINSGNSANIAKGLLESKGSYTPFIRV